MNVAFIMDEVERLVSGDVEVDRHIDIRVCTWQDGRVERTDALGASGGELRIEEVPQRDEHSYFLRFYSIGGLDEHKEAREPDGIGIEIFRAIALLTGDAVAVSVVVAQRFLVAGEDGGIAPVGAVAEDLLEEVLMAVDLLIRYELSIHRFARSSLIVDGQEVDAVRHLRRALYREASYEARTFGVLDLTATLVKLDGLMYTVQLDIVWAHLSGEGLASLECPLGEGKLGDSGLVMPLVLSFIGGDLRGSLTTAAEDSYEEDGECSEAET
jgi:hypothetical protein